MASLPRDGQDGDPVDAETAGRGNNEFALALFYELRSMAGNL
jgi:hypothetical protein